MFDCHSFLLQTPVSSKMRLIASIAVFVFCTIQNIACDDDDTLIQIKQGLIRGEKLKTVVEGKEYYSYKGIPYAKPPTGSLRFMAPNEAELWDGVRNCTEHGSVCPQFNPITNIYTPGSEDCLFLNVYSPNIKPETPHSVMAFIHGGAYMFGSGDTDLYGPDYFIEQNLVVVTMNYRLGALGFLSTSNEDVPGNAGLKDQVLALQWIQKNIASFGGDPDSVTLLGDTAGAQSVTLHMMSPLSKGLFSRAIAMSGSPTCDYGITYKPERRAQVLATLCNCTDVKNISALITCLQEIPYKTFFDLNPAVLASETITKVLFKMEDFTPVIEKKTGNNFLTEEYNVILKNGNFNKDVGFMIGLSGKEAVLLVDLYYASYIDIYKRYSELFVPSELLMKCTPDKILEMSGRIIKYYFGEKEVTVDNIVSFVNYASNASIGYHAQRFVDKWATWGQNTYFFKFESTTSWNTYGQAGIKYGMKEAAHMDWIPYIFLPASLNGVVDTDSLEYKLSQDIVTALANFAKTGNPSVNDIEWTQYSLSNPAYMRFRNDGMKLDYKPDSADNEFWKSIYEYAEVSY